MESKSETSRRAVSPLRASAAGQAFSIPDALMAVRWAGLLRGRGYRLTFSHAVRNADEVLEIRIPPHQTPIYRLYRGACGIWAIDCVGRSRIFPTLADALLAVTPLSAHDRRHVLKPRAPGWLPLGTGPSVVQRAIAAICSFVHGSPVGALENSRSSERLDTGG